MRKTQSPKRKKFRLLLDAAFTKPSTFQALSKKANIVHVRHTYNLSPTTEDKDIYQLATREERFVVTLDQDFRKLIKTGKAGVIFVSPYSSNEQIDRDLSKFIQNKNPDDYIGKAIKIPVSKEQS